MVTRIALVGDYDSSVVAHRAIDESFAELKKQYLELSADWVATINIGDPSKTLSPYAGIWCVPASPYASMDGALAAIRFARETNRPFLGTCGGFQHAILEYARNVLGLVQAEHSETAPDATMQVISRLSCSLVEKSGTLFLTKQSQLHSICGTDTIEESYHCNYGFNPKYETLFTQDKNLLVSARDSAGEVRAIELTNHPFFMGTLFQPERAVLKGQVQHVPIHPIVKAFVESAKQTK